MNLGVAHKPLTVLNEKLEPLPHVEIPSQIMVREAKLAANSSVILADKIDINPHYTITKTGKYFVQFTGMALDIGEPLPKQELGRFGENVVIGSFDFLPATNKFPSNIIEIEVIDGRK
jgi:hypothetical protein